MMTSNLSVLSEKIQRLSPEQISEVNDFVEFLSVRGRDRELVRSAAAISASTFESIWDNQQDDAYDAI